MNCRYDLVTNRTYIGQSWLNYKADNLWTENDGHYEWFVQEICTHLRLENDWRSAWGSYCGDLSRRLADQAKCCPDCGVATGTLPSDGCDIESCPDCGGQNNSCGCIAADNRIPWTGDLPEKRECREFGWNVKLVPDAPGWTRCAQDDPEATEDLNRLYVDAVGSSDQQRFVLPSLGSPVKRIPHGEPIPTEIWARAIATLKAHHEAGLAWIDAQRPRSGILYAQFCEAEEAYNQMANAIWFAKWTRDQRSEWACICAENVRPLKIELTY